MCFMSSMCLKSPCEIRKNQNMNHWHSRQFDSCCIEHRRNRTLSIWKIHSEVPSIQWPKIQTNGR
jgi:hypothetical protein